jgi:hypothetical protein
MAEKDARPKEIARRAEKMGKDAVFAAQSIAEQHVALVQRLDEQEAAIKVLWQRQRSMAEVVAVMEEMDVTLTALKNMLLRKGGHTEEELREEMERVRRFREMLLKQQAEKEAAAIVEAAQMPEVEKEVLEGYPDGVTVFGG